jgi:methenyltetrahydromethanopterin cyclohydrolase
LTTDQADVNPEMPTFNLNEQANRVADRIAANAAGLKVTVTSIAGARVIDCGIQEPGGLQAGLELARVCLADLAEVTLMAGEVAGVACPYIQVATDHPVLACLASQYAGWQVQVGKFFAMGSGPMRAAYGKEPIFEHIPGRERPSVAVGVLETRKLPNDDVIRYLCERMNLAAEHLTLLCAPTTSIAGTMQIVARSLETALHKLHELKFDLSQLISGFGAAPLPPVAADDIAAIGRTNDAILYGGRAILCVRSDDNELAQVGPRVPSRASPDHGAPFALVFERYERDFYKIDPMLFSPAQVVFQNLNTGQTHWFGQVEPDTLQRSFFTTR